MGVPKFAAWLTKKYPSMVVNRCPSDVHGLYIDLNGLIHPCCHDEHDASVALRTQEEKLRSICLAIETLVVTVKPQHVVYIAIDGVAPRAKMNQQRARRYMSAAVPLTDTEKPVHGGSHEISAGVVAAIEKEFTPAERDGAERDLEDVSQALMGDVLYGGGGIDLAAAPGATEEGEATSPASAPAPPPSTAVHADPSAASPTLPLPPTPPPPAAADAAAAVAPAKFDSNCISPGTVFMNAVAAEVRDYVRRKLAPTSEGGVSGTARPATHAHWAGLTVVFSDSNTAGEGEHKFLDFLRTQSAFSGFNGGGSHVIAGLDADLIFLSLSLHIPRVVILRDHDRSTYAQALLPDTLGGTLVTVKVQVGAAPARGRAAGGPLVASASTSSIGSVAALAAGAEGEAASPVSGTASTTALSEDGEKDAVAPAELLSSGSPTSASPASPLAEVLCTPATPLPPVPIADMIVAPCSGYEYFDLDVVGAALVSEVYQLSLDKGVQLRGDPLAVAANCIAANGFRFHFSNDGGVGPAETATAAAESTGAATATAATATTTTKNAEMHGGKRDGRARAPPPPFHPCTATSNSKIIDDFIVLGMLLGNDFLPHLPSVYCGESAMDTILDVYVGAVLPYGYLTGGQYEIQLAQLERFLRAYAAVEAMRFRQFAIQAGAMTPQEAATAELYSATDRRCWRDPYVRTTTLRDEAGVQAACRAYVEGLRFVWRYYSSISLQVSWSWYYPFHHAPLALDVADFLHAQGPEVQTTLAAPKLERQPPTPFCQLLCILPPRSRGLVPAALQPLMTSPPPELADTFPHRWTVDSTGAYGKDHLAAVLLPFANLPRLQEAVATAADTYTAEERQRNTLLSQHHVFQVRPAEAPPGAAESADGAAAADGASTPSKPPRPSPRRKPSPAAAAATSASSSRTFRIQGGGLTELRADDVPADLRDCCDVVMCLALVEVVPPLSRPRSYSYTVPIPSLTVLPDGTRIPEDRRPPFRQGGRRGRNGPGGGGSGGRGRDDKAVASAAAGKVPEAESAKPAMLFGEFALCLVAVGVVAAAAVLWHTSASAFALLSWGGPMLLQVCSVAVAAVMLAFALGLAVAAKGRTAGSGLHRHSIFTAFADWQCAACLSLNFSRNRRCFVCRAPFDPHSCVAVYSGRNPPEPPLMDPNHAAYTASYGVRSPA